MSQLYVPAPGAYFRLLGYQSSKVIYARRTPEPQVGHTDLVFPGIDAQYFRLVAGTGQWAGQYIFKSKACQTVLYSRTHAAPNFWHTEGDGWFADNWFTLEPGQGEYEGTFRMINLYSSTAAYSRLTSEPTLWNTANNTVKSADQHFSFLFDDITIQSFEYQLNLGKIVSSASQIIDTKSVTNNTDAEEQSTVNLSKSLLHTSSYEHKVGGIKLAVGVSFQIRVPQIVGGKIVIDNTSQPQNAILGTGTAFDQPYTVAVDVKAPPHSTVLAEASVTTGDLEVPYIIWLVSKSTGVKYKSNGIWRGTSSWNLLQSVKPVAT